MNNRVRVSEQVEGFVKALAPDPRKALRAGIKGLARGEKNTRRLEGDLAGWQRLRVGEFRLGYKEAFAPFAGGERILDCAYFNRRSVVYDLFQELVQHSFLRSPARALRALARREPHEVGCRAPARGKPTIGRPSICAPVAF
jgi:mRNA interferase RelE/StbE